MINFYYFSVTALDISQILISVFLAITFLQSSIDKIWDRKGNLDWLTGHFSNSPLKNNVPIVLMIITLSELLGGVFMSYWNCYFFCKWNERINALRIYN